METEGRITKNKTGWKGYFNRVALYYTYAEGLLSIPHICREAEFFDLLLQLTVSNTSSIQIEDAVGELRESNRVHEDQLNRIWKLIVDSYSEGNLFRLLFFSLVRSRI